MKTSPSPTPTSDPVSAARSPTSPESSEKAITTQVDALIDAVRGGDEAAIAEARQRVLSVTLHRIRQASMGAAANTRTDPSVADYSTSGSADTTTHEGTAARQLDSANRSMW